MLKISWAALGLFLDLFVEMFVGMRLGCLHVWVFVDAADAFGGVMWGDDEGMSLGFCFGMPLWRTSLRMCLPACLWG